jgi:hypothetical protein
MPTFTYDSSGLVADKYGMMSADSFLQDYYGQMTNGYLPTIDKFATDNADKMVVFDPNAAMSIEDFGLASNRGGLRGIDLIHNSHDLSAVDDSGFNSAYYIKLPNGQYTNAMALNGPNGMPRQGFSNVDEGTELFKIKLANGVNDDGTWNANEENAYIADGKYHRETPQEAAARMISQGGGYVTGHGADFGGEDQLNRITTDVGGKWGADYVNMPELKPYLDDPAWVTRDDKGKITNIRAELVPLLMRESLGEEYRDITRGNTKSSDFLGDLIGSIALGAITGGMGIAGAGAMGLSSAAAGAGLGATAAGLGAGGMAVAGGLGGALGSAVTGGNVLKGGLTGALSGGFSKWASPTVSNSLKGLGITGGANSALTGGLTSATGGGLSSLITGNQFNPLSSFSTGALGQVAESQKGWMNNLLGEAKINPQLAGFIESQVGKALIQKITTGEIRMNPRDVVPFLSKQALALGSTQPSPSAGVTQRI